MVTPMRQKSRIDWVIVFVYAKIDEEPNFIESVFIGGRG
jgi:hypothetical protein